MASRWSGNLLHGWGVWEPPDQQMSGNRNRRSKHCWVHSLMRMVCFLTNLFLQHRQSLLQFTWQLWNARCVAFVKSDLSTANWQLEFAAWRRTGTYHNSSDTLLCQKSNHCLIIPLLLTGFGFGRLFFCFIKSSWRWKAHFSRIFRPSKVLVWWSWRHSYKLNSPECLTTFWVLPWVYTKRRILCKGSMWMNLYIIRSLLLMHVVWELFRHTVYTVYLTSWMLIQSTWWLTLILICVNTMCSCLMFCLGV